MTVARSGLDRLMTIKECAAYLGVAERSLANEWRKWGLTAVHVGSLVRFREKDVAAWLETRQEKGR